MKNKTMTVYLPISRSKKLKKLNTIKRMPIPKLTALTQKVTLQPQKVRSSVYAAGALF